MMAISNFADWVAPTVSSTGEASSDVGSATQAEQDFAALLAASYAVTTMPAAPNPVAAPPAETLGQSAEVSATMLSVPTDVLASIKSKSQDLAEFTSTKLSEAPVEQAALSEPKLQQQFSVPSNTVAEVGPQTLDAMMPPTAVAPKSEGFPVPNAAATQASQETLSPALNPIRQPELVPNAAQPTSPATSASPEIANAQELKSPDAVGSAAPQTTTDLKASTPITTERPSPLRQENNRLPAAPTAPSTSASETPSASLTVTSSITSIDSIPSPTESQTSTKSLLAGSATPLKVAAAIVKTIVSEPYANSLPTKELTLGLKEAGNAPSLTTESSASAAAIAAQLPTEAVEITTVAAATILSTLKPEPSRVATTSQLAIGTQPETATESDLSVQSPPLAEKMPIKALSTSSLQFVPEPTPQQSANIPAASQQALTAQTPVATSVDATAVTNQETGTPVPNTPSSAYDSGLTLQADFLPHETPDKIFAEDFNAVTMAPIATANQPLSSSTKADVSTPAQQAVVQQTTQPLVEFAQSVPHRETQTLRLSLNPVELGRVQIEVTRDEEGRVHASFTVEQADTAQTLTHNIGHLRESLERAGLAVEQLQVTSQSQPQPSAQMGQWGQSGQQPGQHQPTPQSHMTHGNTPLTESGVSGNPTSATDNKLLSMHA